MSSNNNINSEICIFSEGTIIDGDIKVNANIRLEGVINGNITCNGRLVMSKTSEVYGHVSCDDLTSGGKIIGNINSAKAVELTYSATLEGDIQCSSIIIEKGASYNGTCTMLKKIN